jgi:hypothetical protein
MCNCGKSKAGVSSMFTVTQADGTKKDVASEQEARAIVRMSGGSYTRKK